MEKEYLTPELEIMFLVRADVIVASNPASGDDTSDTGTDESKTLGDE